MHPGEAEGCQIFLAISFTVEGKISRKEYGLEWNAVTEAGKVVVGDDIKIHADIQVVKQK